MLLRDQYHSIRPDGAQLIKFRMRLRSLLLRRIDAMRVKWPNSSAAMSQRLCHEAMPACTHRFERANWLPIASTLIQAAIPNWELSFAGHIEPLRYHDSPVGPRPRSRLTLRRAEAQIPLSLAEIQAHKGQFVPNSITTCRLESSIEQLRAKNKAVAGTATAASTAEGCGRVPAAGYARSGCGGGGWFS